MTRRSLGLLTLVLALAACSGPTGGPSGYGRFVAPLAGGAQTSAEAVVGEVGAPRTALNPELLSLLDGRARVIAAEAQYQALEGHGAGVSVRWRTPSDDIRGEVVPGPLYAVNVQRCRDFTHSVEQGGNRWSRRDTACRADDGSWDLIT